MNVMDWKLKTTPVVSLQRPSKTFVYFAFLPLCFVLVIYKCYRA